MMLRLRISPCILLQIEDLMGDLGGILGLYIGFSALTILEFWELFVDIFVLATIKRCSRKRQKTCRCSSKIEPFSTSESAGVHQPLPTDSGNWSAPSLPYTYKSNNLRD